MLICNFQGSDYYNITVILCILICLYTSLSGYTSVYPYINLRLILALIFYNRFHYGKIFWLFFSNSYLMITLSFAPPFSINIFAPCQCPTVPGPRSGSCFLIKKNHYAQRTHVQENTINRPIYQMHQHRPLHSQPKINNDSSSFGGKTDVIGANIAPELPNNQTRLDLQFCSVLNYVILDFFYTIRLNKILHVYMWNICCYILLHSRVHIYVYTLICIYVFSTSTKVSLRFSCVDCTSWHVTTH